MAFPTEITEAFARADAAMEAAQHAREELDELVVELSDVQTRHEESRLASETATAASRAAASEAVRLVREHYGLDPKSQAPRQRRPGQHSTP